MDESELGFGRLQKCCLPKLNSVRVAYSELPRNWGKIIFIIIFRLFGDDKAESLNAPETQEDNFLLCVISLATTCGTYTLNLISITKGASASIIHTRVAIIRNSMPM